MSSPKSRSLDRYSQHRQVNRMEYFATGKTNSPIKYQRFTKRVADPGPSSTIADRNFHTHYDMNVKPINSITHSKSFYNPQRCRDPLGDHKTLTKEPTVNSLHATKLLNSKKSAKDFSSTQPLSKELHDVNSFESRKHLSQTRGSTPARRNASLVLEQLGKITKNENIYY